MAIVTLMISFFDRVRTLIPHKIVLYLGLTVGICVPYRYIQDLPKTTTYTFFPTALDTAITFDPNWVWAYISISLLVPLGPALCVTKRQLIGYAYGLAVVCIPSFVIFFLFPVEGPRPDVAPHHGVYQLLVGLDRNWNSIPSLHVSLTMFSIYFTLSVLNADNSLKGSAWLRPIMWTWGAIVIYSTLATKQHWAYDIPPALVLGWLGYRVSKIWSREQKVYPDLQG